MWHSAHSKVSSLAQDRGSMRSPTGVKEGCLWCWELQGGLPDALHERTVLEFLWLWGLRWISSCRSSAADEPPSSTEQQGTGHTS